MAMDGSILGLALLQAIESLSVGIVPGDSKEIIAEKQQAYQLSLMKAIGNVVVNHIQTFAVVTSTVAVASVTGVTIGSSPSGPGTGTATGQIS